MCLRHYLDVDDDDDDNDDNDHDDEDNVDFYSTGLNRLNDVQK